MTIVELARKDRGRIEAETRAALPRECCGLIEGRRGDAVICVHAVHAVRNIADTAERFEIDPGEHFRLLRAARSRGNEIVGCYHSHPGAAPEPSLLDHAGAAEDGFLWLIAGLPAADVELRAYVFKSGVFVRIELAEMP